MYGFSEATKANAFVVDIFPVRQYSFPLLPTPPHETHNFTPVRYVPAWFPGAGFKREALFARQLSMDMRSAPFEAVKQQMVLPISCASPIIDAADTSPRPKALPFRPW